MRIFLSLMLFAFSLNLHASLTVNAPSFLVEGQNGNITWDFQTTINNPLSSSVRFSKKMSNGSYQPINPSANAQGSYTHISTVNNTGLITYKIEGCNYYLINGGPAVRYTCSEEKIITINVFRISPNPTTNFSISGHSPSQSYLPFTIS